MGANVPLSKEEQKRIVELTNAGKSTRDIGRILGRHHSCINTYVQKIGAEKVEQMPATQEPMRFDAVRKALKNGPLSKEQLADALDCSPRKVGELLEEMRVRGALLGEDGGRYFLKSSEWIEPTENPPLVARRVEGFNHRYGVTSDNHLCNRNARLDVLNAAYDTFEREGITDVLNPGNWIDGEHRFTRPECIVRPGMDAQIEYMIDNFPQRKGITTHYIAGDDHEGWYQQRECIEIGRYLQMSAEKAGRNDLKYLGYAEADVPLESPGGTAIMRVVHPGGGSAYAISYTDQKRVESYQGGEKPQVEVVGHYHKYNVGYPREVTTIQAGCTCDQTLFMRKKRLQAMVGFCIIEIAQDNTDGHIKRVRHEWFPFFDKGYYQRYK